MHVTDAQECGPIPLIISGAPRSGTTLLYNLFDGHPDISWLVTECYFFEYLHECGPKNAWIYRELAGAGLDALIEGIRDRDVLPRIGSKYAQVFAGTMKTHVEYPISWDEDAFRASLAGADFSSIASMWASLSRACLAGLGETEKSIVCLKSPDYGKSAFAAVEALSTAKSIVILRDPVAAIDSLKYTREKRREKLLTWPTLSMVIGNYLRMFETLLTT